MVKILSFEKAAKPEEPEKPEKKEFPQGHMARVDKFPVTPEIISRQQDVVFEASEKEIRVGEAKNWREEWKSQEGKTLIARYEHVRDEVLMHPAAFTEEFESSLYKLCKEFEDDSSVFFRHPMSYYKERLKDIEKEVKAKKPLIDLVEKWEEPLMISNARRISKMPPDSPLQQELFKVVEDYLTGEVRRHPELYEKYYEDLKRLDRLCDKKRAKAL